MRAFLSVYDKTGVVELAAGLADQGWQLVSSGGTAEAIRGAGLEVTSTEEVTGYPAILGHRVATLHPKIHGGILADPTDPEHRADLDAYDIEPFALVVSNLYPFGDPDAAGDAGGRRLAASDDGRGIDLIDIGGPAMVRAAAKNHAHVGIIVDPDDYGPVLEEIRADGALGDATRRRLARKAFAHTAAYDAAVVGWFDERDPDPQVLPPTVHLALERDEQALRYGENPHQQGARYRQRGRSSVWDRAEQHAGVALSYLNIFDADAAWNLAHDLAGEFGKPAVAIIKHANPCGAAVADTLERAYELAFECDPRSAFGGIVATSEPIDTGTVEAMVAAAQADVVIAPGYDDGVVDALVAKRKNTRLLTLPRPAGAGRPPAQRHLARAGGPPLRGGAQPVAGGHRATAHRDRAGRRRLRVARLRLGEVQLDRARQGRHGVGHRRRPAEPRRGRPDRGREGRGPGRGRCLRLRRVLPVPRRHRGRGGRRRGGRHPAGRIGQRREVHRHG